MGCGMATGGLAERPYLDLDLALWQTEQYQYHSDGL